MTTTSIGKTFYNAYSQNRYPDLPSTRFAELTDPAQILSPEKAVPTTDKPPTILEQLEKDKTSLQNFLAVLRTPGANGNAEKALNDLIAPLKNTFRYWFWVHTGTPGEKLNQQLSTLLNIKHPYICCEGQNIVEQLIQSLTAKIELLKLKQIQQTINRLESEGRDAALIDQRLRILPGYIGAGANQSISRIKEIYRERMQDLVATQKNGLRKQYDSLSTNPSISFEYLQQLYSQIDVNNNRVDVNNNNSQIDVNNNNAIPTANPVIDQSKATSLNCPSYTLHTQLGAHPTSHGTKFSTFAPHASAVSVIITFDGHHLQKVPMKNNGKGVWEIEIDNVKNGATYLYELTQSGHTQQKLDPFAFSLHRTPKGGYDSVVCDLNYAWTDAKWLETRRKFTEKDTPVSILELHINGWKKDEHGKINYKQLAKELAEYCKRMGFTHVELYGLMDHSNNNPWGAYQPLSFFAPNHRLVNTQESLNAVQQFQEFVNYLHAQNIGVIIDWVPGHFAENENGLASFGGKTLFEFPNPKQAWGCTLFNYENPYVQEFLLSSAYYWLQMMHLDGIRLDSLDTILNNNKWEPAKSVMQKMNTLAKTQFPGALMIAECWRSDGIASEGQSGLGFHRKWSGASKQIHEFMKLSFADRTKSSQLFIITDAPFWDRQPLIWHIDHDQTRQSSGSFYKQMPGNHSQKLANLRLWQSYLMMLPGKKMLFMGSELGQVEDWESRMYKAQSGVQWDLEKHPDHKGVQKMIQQLNFLYTNHPSLFKERGLQWIDVKDTTNNIISFHRGNLACVCNFSPKSFAEYKIYFPSNESKSIGKMTEIFNSDHTEFGGSGNINPNVELIKNGKDTIGFKVRIPPLAAMIFEEQ